MGDQYTLSEKIACLNDVRNQSGKAQLDALYEIMGILDEKATSLLTLDSLVIAVIAALSQDQIKELVDSSATALDWPIIGIALLEALTLSVAVVSCLLVINVKWPFLHYIDPARKTGNLLGSYGLAIEIGNLEDEIANRTRYFQCAWRSNVVALVLPWVLGLLFLLWRATCR